MEPYIKGNVSGITYMSEFIPAAARRFRKKSTQRFAGGMIVEPFPPRNMCQNSVP